MTRKLYYHDSYTQRFAAKIIASDDSRCALDATAFYPGGGGQPADTGRLFANGQEYFVKDCVEDSDGLIWHYIGADLPEGLAVEGLVDWDRRFTFMKYHTLLHIVNAIVLRDYQGLITGAQIGSEHSRIDFNVKSFDKSVLVELEKRIGCVIQQDIRVTSRIITETEFQKKPEFVRTLTVKPPVVDGKIRVVDIGRFDSQACGGTHVKRTGEIGDCRITKFDNKGRNNKRLYLTLRNQAPERGA